MQKAILTMHFMDGTKLVIRYPKQAGADPTTIAATVKRAIDADKIVVEVDGDLLIVPTRNVKYFHLTPAPDHLPSGVIRQGKLIG
ncbi:MAG: hypothetical protein ACM3H9_01145 [Rhodospirillaceae bacterium]